MDSTEGNPVLRAAILEVVENQLRDNNPPETARTIERLCAAGHTPEEARQYVGAVVSVELFQIMKHHKPFDMKRYLWNLKRLPRMPWDERGRALYKG